MGSPPEPALRPRDKFALCTLTPRAPAGNRAAPRRGEGQERFVPTVQVKVRPGDVHNISSVETTLM